MLSNAERSLVGAARWPDAPGRIKYNKSDTPENKQYCESLWKASRRTASAIASGHISTFEGVWSEATQWRLSRIPANDPRLINFASVREPCTLFVTSLTRQYQSVLARVQRHPEAKTELFNSEYLSGIEAKVYRQHGTIAGMLIPMTVLSAATDTKSLNEQTRSVRRSHDTPEQVEASIKRFHPNMITHTDSDYLPIINQHLESLFSQARNPSLNTQEVLDLVSRVHWWAASAAPDQRGSAAKAEFVARSIASAHGIELPPFRHGFVPDIEAMLRSEDQFVSAYTGLFERNPI